MISSTGYWNLDIKDFHKEHLYDHVLAEAITNIMKIHNVTEVYDFGCGEGKYVQYFNSNNINALGFDGNPNTNNISSCRVQDLTDPNFNEKPLDFVVCLEVSEHVPKLYEEQLLKNIDKHINPGGILVLSWAIVGQSGTGHVNCQNNDYVINKYNEMGYDYNTELTNFLRTHSMLHYFKNTILVFSKNNLKL